MWSGETLRGRDTRDRTVTWHLGIDRSTPSEGYPQQQYARPPLDGWIGPKVSSQESVVIDSQ